MILDLKGKPIEELGDLDLSDAQLTGEGISGLELIARERPRIIEEALPQYDKGARREAIAAAIASLGARSPTNSPYEHNHTPSRMPSQGLDRRAFLVGAIASLGAYGLNPSQAGAQGFFKNLFKDEGYNSPHSLHIPTGKYITEEDYPPMNSAISEDVPGDYQRVVRNGNAGNMDFAAKRDGSTQVVPAAMGDVSEAGYSTPNGWFVILRHGLGYATEYAHLRKISDSILTNGNARKGLEITPEDVIGEAGNEGTGAKGWYHLGFALLVPTKEKPNNQFTKLKGQTGYTADPARFAEYCVVGKKVGDKLVKICNYSINYRQTEDFDTGLWEKDKEFRKYLGELRRDLKMSRIDFKEQVMRKVLYYFHLEMIEERLKAKFDGKLDARKAEEYLEGLQEFKTFRGPILTAPIKNPYRPGLYAR